MDPPTPHRVSFERGAHLPHLLRENHPHFVTFRLADALPFAITQRRDRQRIGWLRRHGIDGDNSTWRNAVASLPVEDRLEFQRRFAHSLLQHLDRGHGACFLRSPRIAAVVAEALRHFDGSRCVLGRFVIMPNHVHVLVTPFEGHDVRALGESWRSFSARAINRLLGRTGRLWQPEGWDHLVRNSVRLAQIEAYIEGDGQHLPAGDVLHG